MDIIYTNRLILRPWNVNDISDFHEFMCDKKVAECSGGNIITDIEVSKECLDNYIKCDLSYAIVLKRSNKVIGSIGMDIVTPDKNYSNLNQRYIGYTIHPDYWGYGYATEVTKGLIKYLFEICNLDLIWTSHYDFNIKSRNVIGKCGFTYEFRGKKKLKSLGGKSVEELFYKITKSDFVKQDSYLRENIK